MSKSGYNYNYCTFSLSLFLFSHQQRSKMNRDDYNDNRVHFGEKNPVVSIYLQLDYLNRLFCLNCYRMKKTVLIKRSYSKLNTNNITRIK